MEWVGFGEASDFGEACTALQRDGKDERDERHRRFAPIHWGFLGDMHCMLGLGLWADKPAEVTADTGAAKFDHLTIASALQHGVGLFSVDWSRKIARLALIGFE